MAWKDETRDINFILERLSDTLDNIWADCQILRALQIPEVDITACSIEENIQEYKNYTQQYRLAIDKTREQNKQLKEQNKVLKQQIIDRDNQIFMINETLDDRYKTLDSLIDIIDKNAKAISFSQYTKSSIDKSGVNSPRYRKDVNDNQLIADYQAGMILKDLSVKYKLTIPGVRNRLIDLGVYKQKYNKNK